MKRPTVESLSLRAGRPIYLFNRFASAIFFYRSALALFFLTTGSLRGRPGGRLGGAPAARSSAALRGLEGDDLHPLRCLLLDLLTAGSPEEAEEASPVAFALRLRLRPLRGEGRSRGPLIDPRFGQKYWFLDPRQPKISSRFRDDRKSPRPINNPLPNQ